ncbi:homeobox protein notochord [Cebus imitator]|uniref:homeobox protein notochord n=1 Tax=Cebus imitator TaxID=2715852 RepID=UPI000809FA91|nr:homeobox protein notochord [Cebus imitator]
MGRAKPSPRSPGSLPPAPSGTRVRPTRSGPSRSPALGSPTGQKTPRTPGRFQSPFSVEAILSRPDPVAPAASPLSVSACAHQHLWTAPSPCNAQSLFWPCRASWPPAYLSVSLYPLCSPRPMPGPRVAPVCSLRGFGITGLELAHCSRLWAFPGWAPTEDLQDTERQQKRVRTMFNLEQLEELEKMFVKQHNLVGKKRAQLAARLNLTENQVRVWFQNRRVKYQKQQKLRAAKAAAEAASLDEPSSSSSASIQSDDAESGVDS